MLTAFEVATMVFSCIGWLCYLLERDRSHQLAKAWERAEQRYLERVKEFHRLAKVGHSFMAKKIYAYEVLLAAEQRKQ